MTKAEALGLLPFTHVKLQSPDFSGLTIYVAPPFVPELDQYTQKSLHGYDAFQIRFTDLAGNEVVAEVEDYHFSDPEPDPMTHLPRPLTPTQYRLNMHFKTFASEYYMVLTASGAGLPYELFLYDKKPGQPIPILSPISPLFQLISKPFHRYTGPGPAAVPHDKWLVETPKTLSVVTLLAGQDKLRLSVEVDPLFGMESNLLDFLKRNPQLTISRPRNFPFHIRLDRSNSKAVLTIENLHLDFYHFSRFSVSQHLVVYTLHLEATSQTLGRIEIQMNGELGGAQRTEVFGSSITSAQPVVQDFNQLVFSHWPDTRPPGPSATPAAASNVSVSNPVANSMFSTAVFDSEPLAWKRAATWSRLNVVDATEIISAIEAIRGPSFEAVANQLRPFQSRMAGDLTKMEPRVFRSKQPSC